MTGRWSGCWHILDGETRVSLESHFHEHSAVYFCAAVNDHEERNGRPRRYVIERLSQDYRRPAR